MLDNDVKQIPKRLQLVNFYTKSSHKHIGTGSIQFCGKMNVLHVILEIRTKHVLWPQIDSPVHWDQSIWGKLNKFVS